MRGGRSEGWGRALGCALPPLLLAACGESPSAPIQVPGAAAVGAFTIGGDWPSYGRDLAGTRFSPLRELNPINVDELRQAWAYPLGGGAASGGSELTPLVVAGVLYAAAADRVVALRAHSGEELWRHVLKYGAPSRRGLAYWGADDVGPRIFVTAGRRLLALEAGSGQPAAAFGTAGEIPLPASYNAAPTVFEDLVIVGSQSRPGGLRAFDARTGTLRWTFEVDGLSLPSPFFTIDVDRALLYAVVAGPEEDAYYGGGRGTDSELANAIVALDVRTGERRWHFQTVHHDLWDYDLVAPPALLEATIGGARVPVLAQAAPTGYVYVLNRVTGAPVFGVAEVPVPTSEVPGERAAPTQPIPVKPPPLARVSFLPEDLVTAIDTTPQHAAACRALRDRYGARNLGPFTPYGYQEPGAPARATAVFPGGLGGAGFGGVATEPRAGLVFVNMTSAGDLAWLERNGADRAAAQTGDGSRRARLPYRRVGALDRMDTRFAMSDAPLEKAAAASGSDLWPCQKPPWGELAAVAVASGEVLWRVPLGVTEQLPEARRRTGRPNVGGALATAAGLVFIGASNDRRFRAFDARTGRELWTTELPRSAHAAPITYLGADGKQYVAIVAAGALAIDDPGAADAQALIAYALP